MKLFTSILVFSILITFPSISQIKVTILNQTDSLEMMGVICTNQQNKILSVSDSKGNLSLSKNGSYILVHPSFYALKIDQFKNDTLVYLQPLVREIEEVEIISTTNENLFNLVIQQYRHDLGNSSRKGILNYKNTNWFTYDYLEEQKRDSAYCAIENTFSFEVDQTKKKSKILFSPIFLNRYCSDFSFPKNADIKTAEIPAFSKFDFTRFLNALFTEGSFFDEIGFTHTQSTKRVDEINKTIELKFLSDGYEKTIVFSSIDSSLLSYKYQYSGKQRWYHVYFATFSGQEVETFYEEKGFLFDYEKQNHLFHSIHYGCFNTDFKTVSLSNPIGFSEIIKSQVNSNPEKPISGLVPLYESFNGYD
ncbi:MAG: hypothetical protein A3D31_11400 [Candidatus Fluviicola riflensis]|nr:MAG: hypothetical protein CHH17_15825 [Candidatus Fluviicola riflensis]OGS77595.1 MAG: hypothetical protein A3D31_11400 [Candidatus Fluviicola riflensis]OGS84177.1 MAG: hypothetical protein A3E30_12805 [Fluviicola sp. RIFCSPHIGHO2_12_FULL_43_24]OGS84661.1 MAG: hypothetical protein A2724_08335 [Fluviicola sp. RIFCSPHIGHO2_01_FULL_43_53]